MSRTARGRTIRTIRATAIALLGISVLAIPTVNAQRPETSPATLDIKANPSFANAAAIRGTTFSNSSGPDDIPSGLIGHATGNAEGTDGLVRAVFGLSNGNAVGQDSRVAGVEGRTSGDALGSGATVFAVRGTATGSALGDNFSLVGGVDGRSRGNAVAADSRVFGVRGAVEGTGIGSNAFAAGVFGRAFATSGPSHGLVGFTDSPEGAGVRAANFAGGRAGLFEGRVEINCGSFPCVQVNGTGIADMAESLPVASAVSPGDAVVLTSTGANGYGIAPAVHAYDTLIAGIVSAQPRIVLQTQHSGPVAPVAMIGIVRAKASAINGSIQFGDLLTTSSVPGHLMRCVTAIRCAGAIVGKAIEPLPNGEGQILVLLWRQ